MKRKYYYILLLLCIFNFTGCTNEKEDVSTDALKVTYNIDSGFLEGEGVSYQIDDNNAVVAGHSDMDIENIVIPDKINYENKDYPVIKIASSAFESDTSLVSLTTGVNIIEIEESAFYSCDTLETNLR